MSSYPEDAQASHQLLVAGFIGGFGLAALVLILQNAKPFEKQEWFISAHDYFVLLVVILAVMIAASVFSSTVEIDIAGGVHHWSSAYGEMGQNLLILAFICVCVSMPLLILPFTRVGAGVVAVAEVLMLVAVALADRSAKQ